MISRTAEYALRAVVCLAAGPERPMTSPEIARLARIPPGYLAKIMGALARGRIVRSRRGVGGGFLLARPVEELTALEVVDAVDPIRRIRACPLDLAEHRAALCPLHHCLDQALGAVQSALGATLIRDLRGTPAAQSPLCDAAMTPSAHLSPGDREPEGGPPDANPARGARRPGGRAPAQAEHGARRSARRPAHAD